MFGIINFGAFLVTGILLNITPGADTMYILGRSISQGKKAGLLSVLGICTGSLVHTILAALGLSLILAQSATAFNVIKYLGALYLIYLGLKALMSKSKGSFSIDNATAFVSYRKIFLSGVLTNVLNPKVALFFLALLPQFIDPTYPNSTLSFMILGLTFLTTGAIWCLLLAFFSAKLSDKIRKNYKVKMWLDKITGGVFILLGIKLALSKR